MPEPAHNRHSLRLPGYDYAQAGGYFVTLLTWRREQTLGDIMAGVVQLSPLGKIAQSEWQRLESRFPYLGLDEFVIMPNHIHCILFLRSADDVRARLNLLDHDPERSASPLPKGTAPRSLGAVIGAYKSSISNRAHYLLDNPRIPVWQRNYYEHVIRNETELQKIRQYIRNNPLQWELDEENTERKTP